MNIDPVRGDKSIIGTSIAPANQTQSTAPTVTPEEKKLRKAAGELQGLFVAQLFKAMRDTVPTDDAMVSGGSGEEIFTGLMDEHLAADTPKHWSGGISEALYRQLRHGLGGAASGSTTAPSTTVQAVQSSDPLAR
ncbi:MAG: rod-binding protein [Gemmatimonadaceae bacterium]